MSRSTCHGEFPGDRLNVAVGLLERVSHLEALVEAFRAYSVDLACCHLVATRESNIFEDQFAARVDGQIRVVRIALESLVAENMWTDVILASSNTMDLGASHGVVSEYAPGPPALMRQNHRLMQHLVSGGGVLVVALEDDLQQQVIAGLLLKLASAVFTHQMGARAGRNAPSCPAAMTPPQVVERGVDGALHAPRPAI